MSFVPAVQAPGAAGLNECSFSMLKLTYAMAKRQEANWRNLEKIGWDGVHPALLASLQLIAGELEVFAVRPHRPRRDPVKFICIQ